MCDVTKYGRGGKQVGLYLLLRSETVCDVTRYGRGGKRVGQRVCFEAQVGGEARICCLKLELYVLQLTTAETEGG